MKKVNFEKMTVILLSINTVILGILLCMMLLVAGTISRNDNSNLPRKSNTYTDGVVTAILDQKSETLTFSGNGSVDTTILWLNYDYEQKSLVRTIIFEEEITSIGSSEFSSLDGFINLEKVIFRGDINAIDDGAFYDNLNLTTVEFRGKCQKIARGAFSECLMLSEVNIPDECQIEEGAFSGTQVDVAPTETRSLDDIEVDDNIPKSEPEPKPPLPSLL